MHHRIGDVDPAPPVPLRAALQKSKDEAQRLPDPESKQQQE